MLRDRRLQRRRNRLPDRDHLLRQFQHPIEHEAHPRGVNRRIALILQPFRVSLLQRAEDIRIVRVEALREGAQQHRHRQERAGNFEQ